MMKKSGNKVLDSMLGDSSRQSHFAVLPSYKMSTKEWNCEEFACLSGSDTGAKHLAAVNFTAEVLLFTQIQ